MERFLCEGDERFFLFFGGTRDIRGNFPSHGKLLKRRRHQ